MAADSRKVPIVLVYSIYIATIYVYCHLHLLYAFVAKYQ